MRLLTIESKQELNFVFGFLKLYKHTPQDFPSIVLNHIDFWTAGKISQEGIISSQGLDSTWEHRWEEGAWHWTGRTGGQSNDTLFDENVLQPNESNESTYSSDKIRAVFYHHESGATPAELCLQITDYPSANREPELTAFDCIFPKHPAIPLCEAYLPQNCY